MDLSKRDFETFKNECYADTSPLQAEFMRLYDITSHEEWFYDHGIGVFHFKSHNGQNLYFKYIDVGSFSTETNTWNWSWNNQSTPNQVKRGLEKVVDFGEKKGFKPLTQGLIDGDEYTGWEMTTVAAKLLNAIGMYRVPHEHLFIYFIFTNELTEEEYNAIKEKYIACDVHGTGRIAFVCQHLIKSEYTGFHEAFESNLLNEPDDDYQAWCNECEEVRLKEDGWNEESMAFAKIKLICDQCYFQIKERNQKDN